MLTDTQIAAYQTRAGCCALSEWDAAAQDLVYGDPKSSKIHRQKALWLLWAQGIFCGTITEANPIGCYTREYASEVADRVDCFCACNDCGQSGTSGSFPPNIECAIIVGYPVIDAIAQGDLPGGATEGDAYYILSGANVGQIATWTSGAWVYSTIPNSSVVQTQAGIYYSNYGTGPGPLFPPVVANWTVGTTLYEVVSTAPQMNVLGRQAAIMLYGPGGWQNIATVPESALQTPTEMNFFGTSATLVYVNYIQDGCSWPSTQTQLQPALCELPRDHNCADHNSLDHT